MNDSIQIEILKNKIILLQSQFDSIAQSSSIRQIEYQLHEKQNVLSQVNDFYDSAWLKLIIVISVLGIIIPIIAQYFQSKNLKDLTDFIQKQLNDGFNLRLTELKEFNSKEIANSVSNLNTELAKMNERNNILLKELDTSTYFLQGRSFMAEDNYSQAIPSLFMAAYNALESERVERVTAPIVNAKVCFEKINDIKTLGKIDKSLNNSSWNKSLSDIMEFFKSHSEIKRYEQYLNVISKEIERIKNGG